MMIEVELHELHALRKMVQGNNAAINWIDTKLPPTPMKAAPSEFFALSRAIDILGEGCREMDARIALLRNFPDYSYPDEVMNRRPDSYSEAYSRHTHDGVGGGGTAPAYTSDLEAARKLVPDGWEVSITIPSLRGFSYVRMKDGQHDFAIEANTPALGLCSAALKAHAKKP